LLERRSEGSRGSEWTGSSRREKKRGVWLKTVEARARCPWSLTTSGFDKGETTPASEVHDPEKIETSNFTEPDQNDQVNTTQNNDSPSSNPTEQTHQPTNTTNLPTASTPRTHSTTIQPPNYPNPPIELAENLLPITPKDHTITIKHRHSPLNSLTPPSPYSPDSSPSPPPSPIYSIHNEDLPWDSDI
jgi:hypothetical protein